MSCRKPVNIDYSSVVFVGPRATFARYFRQKVRFSTTDGHTYELETFGANEAPNYCTVFINGQSYRLEIAKPSVGIE